MNVLSSRAKPFEVTGRLVLVCLVAFFLAVAAANAIMLGFAVTTFGGVETESAYRAGLAFKAETSAAVAQEARGWKVDTRIEPGGPGIVAHISVRDQAGAAVPNLKADVSLAHPADRRRDVAMAASEESPGVFRAVARGVTGRRTLVVELSRDGERYFRSVDRIVVP